MSTKKKIIAVIGATGNQGGGVVRALQASGIFHVRALTRNPNKNQGVGDEVIGADLNRPETLKTAFEEPTAFSPSPISGKMAQMNWHKAQQPSMQQKRQVFSI